MVLKNGNESVELIRQSYIKEIKSIRPGDEQEFSDIQDALNWLGTSKHCNKPQNMERHLGVVFLVISPDRQYVFLINHIKAQTWLPPGGHVDYGLTFKEAVEVETEEELHIKPNYIYLEPFFLTNTKTRGLNAGHTDTTAWFLLEGDPNSKYEVLQKEACGAKWVFIEELSSMPEFTNLPRVFKKLNLYLNDHFGKTAKT